MDTLVNRIASLRFYDIAKLGREVKGGPLGLDINRAFADKSKGPSKLQFAQYLCDTLPHSKLAEGCEALEPSARQYYADRANGNAKAAQAVPTIKVENVPMPGAEDKARAQRQETAEQAMQEAKPEQVQYVAPLPEDLVKTVESILAQARSTAAGMDNNRMDDVRQLVEQTRETWQVAMHEAIKAACAPQALFVTTNDNGKVDTVKLGRQHATFPRLLQLCATKRPNGQRLNIWMTGPAGSGKTTAAQNVAEALKLPFYFTGAVKDEYKLLGFINATGQTIRTSFREAWEHGGVFLWDEIDGSDAGAMVSFNAALANGLCDFPDGTVKRHADCVVIAAANTWGAGASFEYVGRNKLDAASLDRFAMLAWEYDEALERDTCGNPAWAKLVQAVRAKVKERGIKGVMVTPRASYDGAVMLAAGHDKADVMREIVRKGMTDGQWEQVKPNPYAGEL